MMYENDLISVIVPVYNVEKYVMQALDSIVNQTYKNLEILIIDDGSTDQSPAICDQYSSDVRVRVFHRQNLGISASRQFGIENCKGTYFVTVDSDDYVAEDYVEKLYSAIKENEADVSVCGVRCFADGKDSSYMAYMPPSHYEKLIVTNELLKSNFYRISQEMLLTDSWNKMYKTQFVKDSNVKFDLAKKYNGNDFKFNHHLALHCPTYSICREGLLFHRMRTGSKVQSKDKPLQEGFEIIIESLIEECRILGLSIKEQLSNVYYGLIGIVVQDILLRGGNFKERHSRFNNLILQNKRFLCRHRNQIDKHTGFATFKVGETVLSLPFFALSNALWLDMASLCYNSLRKIKQKLGKIRQ